MKNINKLLILFCFSAALGAIQYVATDALAQSTYFTNRGCVNCHAAPVVASCNGCHYHGNRSLRAVTDKTAYTPGETVSVTLTSGSTRSGWIRAILYDQTGAQVAVSNGNASGMGGSTTFPASLTAPAPATPGSYTWKMAYFGNSNNNGDVHGEAVVNTNAFTVAAAGDTAAPTVTFTLPATATTLTVSVSAFAATDNVGVTGYLINNSATSPAASASGWMATAPTSITAVAGSNTFYAWAKDAAGNVSAVKSATVTVTLPDTSAPVISAFTLPATANNLTIVVSSFTASDNVAITGYLITTSSAVPVASAAGWSASAPASVIAGAGVNTFYAWAKDAAGNVSASKTATVTVTLPDSIAPVVSAFTLPATASSPTVPVSVFTATDNIGVTGYLINTSASAPAASAAGWSATAPTSVTASAGANIFYAWAKDAAGNVSLSRSASVTITSTTTDTTKPTLAISALAHGAYTNKPTLNISGTATDAGGLQTVTINGQAVALNPDGSFSTALNLTAGANTVSVIAIDKAGNQQADTRIITYDATAPLLAVTAPADNSISAQSFITLTGTISENSTVTVTDNGGSPQSASINGNSFIATVNLASGVNTLVITATDLAGNSASAKRTVTYEGGKFTLAVNYPVQDITTRISNLVLKGTVADAVGKVTVTVKMNGRTYKPAVIKGAFKQKLTFTKPNTYSITVTARDASGITSSVSRNVIYRPTIKGHDDDDDEVSSKSSTSTSHPFGWSNPKSSHDTYVEKNGVANCVSCHSIDKSSKGQPMSCYNCHGKEW